MAQEERNKWASSVRNDVGEQNYTNQQFHESRIHPNRSKRIPSLLKAMFEREYGYHIMKQGIPYLATVLKIFSGPNAPKRTSTRGKETTTVDKNNWDASIAAPVESISKAVEKHERIRLIARIPEFDTGLNWPMNEEDFVRICSHGEYHQHHLSTLNEIGDIQVGDLVWVTLRGNNSSPFDGRAAGHIVGLYKKTLLEGIVVKPASPKIAFAKPCKSNRNVTGAPPKYLRGETAGQPNIAYAIIEKYKTKIKTGLYGNGTPQTKYHFNDALTNLWGPEKSFKYDIPGPAPGKDNAFIWVGHLRNNGYLDLLDRPIGLGRETIIYAPMTLDTMVPIELKYYFHDRAGFGHAWVDGPDTKTQKSIELATTQGNDFREKIAPAIKDMIKDRRNFILVIPEMAYSRGFGTKSNNVTRTKKMSVGEKTSFSSGWAWKFSPEVIRTKITKPETLSTIKEYLRGLPVGKLFDEDIAISNVLQKTHLKERETVTFDGSFTGGLFGNFHIEVLDIIKNHLGKMAFDNINYISILADGMGAVNLASIIKFMTYSGVHNSAELSFKSVPINRIDYVESARDAPPVMYNFSSTPVISIYDDYMKERAESHEYFEFNYITEKASTNGRTFFKKLEQVEAFDKAITFAESRGGKKFSLDIKTLEQVEEKTSAIRSAINLHVVPKGPQVASSDTVKKAVYSFTLQNNLEGAPALPNVFDSNPFYTPTNDFVPDHAGAATSRPSEGIAHMHDKDQREAGSRLAQFKNDVLDTLLTSDFCSNTKTQSYCKSGIDKPNYSGGSKLNNKFKAYLKDLKDYYYYGILFAHELNTSKIINDRKQLEDYLKKPPHKVEENLADIIEDNKNEAFFKDYNNKSFGNTFSGLSGAPTTKKFTMKKAFNYLKKATAGQIEMVMPSDPARYDFFVTNGDINEPTGAYGIIMQHIALEEALQKIKDDITGAIKNTSPVETTTPDPNCDPPPITLEEIRTRVLFPSAKNSRFSELTCASNNIKVVSTFEELKAILSWNPIVSDWKAAIAGGKYTDKWPAQENGKLDEAPKYETKTFEYRTRGKINPVYKKSPEVWACISEKIRESWEAACNISNYIPFRITSGIKGRAKHPGVTAYNNGMSIDTFGLSINVDPPLAGYNGKGRPVYSVFTGMWTPGFVETATQELYDLGVLYTKPNTMSEHAVAIITSAGIGSRYLDNAYESGFYYDQNMLGIELAEGHGELEEIDFAAPAGVDEALEELGYPHSAKKPVDTDGGFIMPEPTLRSPDPRLAENWSGAADSYNGPSGEGEKKADYDKIMKLAKGQLIVPPGANPVEWLLTFCERSGMKWGNSFFLRKRFRGMKTGFSFLGADFRDDTPIGWSPTEQKRIAAIYGIPDIVARINAISWLATSVDKHMHFQYYAGGPIITWQEIGENK